MQNRPGSLIDRSLFPSLPWYLSIYWQLFFIAISIVCAEMVVLMVVRWFNFSNSWIAYLLDGLIMLLLILPVIYAFQLRPVLQLVKQRKAADEALKRSEALFKTAFEILPVGAWLTDEAGKIIFSNPTGKKIWAGARYIGIEQFNEYKGWWLDTGKPIEPEDWAVARAVHKGEISLNEELEIECFDGTHKYILNTAIPFRDDQKRMLGVFVVNEDITERKRFEIQLDRQNQDLRALSLAERNQRELAESLTQATLVLNTSLELEEVLRTILEQVQRVIPYCQANIVQVQANQISILHQSGGEGTIPEQESLAKYPHIQEIYTNQQPVLVENAQQMELKPAFPGITCLSSIIAAPLMKGERLSGIIILASDQPGAFNWETVKRLQSFAAPAAAALENARLYTAELQARHVAEVLNTVSLSLSRTLDLETVMNSLLGFIYDLVACDYAYIVIAEDDTKLTLRAKHGFEQENTAKLQMGDSFDTWEKPYLQEVLATKEKKLIRDTQSYPGWDSLITYQTVRSWLGVPMIVNDRVLGVLALASSAADFFTEEHMRWIGTILSQAGVAVQNAWLFEQVRDGQVRFQALSRRLVEVQESERRHIARELHDEASQTLTALMFGLRRLKQQVESMEHLWAEAVDLENLAEVVLENLHRLAVDLRPASLEQLGLAQAAEQLAKDFRERSKTNIRFKTSGSFEEKRLPEFMEIALYRIIQEALTNAVRHASAKNIDLILEYRDSKFVILVEDDGVGFESTKIQKHGHLGLLGIEERAQMLGGTLQIESRYECGTTIVVEVPDANSDINRG